MGIMAKVAASILNDAGGRVVAAEDDLRKARRDGADASVLAGKQRAVEAAEEARAKAARDYRNASR